MNKDTMMTLPTPDVEKDLGRRGIKATFPVEGHEDQVVTLHVYHSKAHRQYYCVVSNRKLEVTDGVVFAIYSPRHSVTFPLESTNRFSAKRLQELYDGVFDNETIMRAVEERLTDDRHLMR